jgi:hypothetical protein
VAASSLSPHAQGHLWIGALAVTLTGATKAGSGAGPLFADAIGHLEVACDLIFSIKHLSLIISSVIGRPGQNATTRSDTAGSQRLPSARSGM